MSLHFEAIPPSSKNDLLVIDTEYHTRRNHKVWTVYLTCLVGILLEIFAKTQANTAHLIVLV